MNIGKNSDTGEMDFLGLTNLKLLTPFDISGVFSIPLGILGFSMLFGV